MDRVDVGFERNDAARTEDGFLVVLEPTLSRTVELGPTDARVAVAKLLDVVLPGCREAGRLGGGDVEDIGPVDLDRAGASR